MWVTHKMHKNKPRKSVIIISYYYFSFATATKCGLRLHILTQRVTQYHVTNKEQERGEGGKEGEAVRADDVTASDSSFDKHE